MEYLCLCKTKRAKCFFFALIIDLSFLFNGLSIGQYVSNSVVGNGNFHVVIFIATLLLQGSRKMFKSNQNCR